MGTSLSYYKLPRLNTPAIPYSGLDYKRPRIECRLLDPVDCFAFRGQRYRRLSLPACLVECDAESAFRLLKYGSVVRLKGPGGVASIADFSTVFRSQFADKRWKRKKTVLNSCWPPESSPASVGCIERTQWNLLLWLERLAALTAQSWTENCLPLPSRIPPVCRSHGGRRRLVVGRSGSRSFEQSLRKFLRAPVWRNPNDARQRPRWP